MDAAQYYVYGRGVYQPHPRRPLPHPRTSDGRPIWEPPIFDYSLLIGEEYEKKREAILKLTHGDVAKTTEILDKEVDKSLMQMYLMYVGEEWRHVSQNEGLDFAKTSFYVGLYEEIKRDMIEAQEEYSELGVAIRKNDEDGSYEVKDLNAQYLFDKEVVSQPVSLIITTHFEELQYCPTTPPHSNRAADGHSVFPYSATLTHNQKATISIRHPQRNTSLQPALPSTFPPYPTFPSFSPGLLKRPNPVFKQSQTSQETPLALHLVSLRIDTSRSYTADAVD